MGFELGDIIASSGIVSDLVSSGNNYSINWTPVAEGESWLYIPGGVAIDDNGGNNLSSDTLRVRYDITQPSMSIISDVAPLTKDSPIPFEITYSEPVTGFDAPDISLSNGFITNFSGGTNHSLSFDGINDYVMAANDLQISDKYTFNIMTKINDRDYPHFIWIGSGSEASWIQIYTQPTDINNGALTVAHNRYTSEFDAHYFETFPLDQWVYLSVVYDSGVVTVYFDGNEVGSSSMPLAADPGNCDLYFGFAMLPEGERYLEGFIDRVSIWNIALESSEIQSYMDSYPNGNEQGLVGYWDFNDGSGSSLRDQSFNENIGTIYGAEWSNDKIDQDDLSRYTFSAQMDNDGRIDVSVPEGLAFDQAGNTNLSLEPYTVYFNGIPPDIPLGLTAVPGDQQVTLSWNLNTEQDLEGYFIHELNDNGYSLNFNGGNEYVEIAPNNDLIFEDGIMTISTWVKIPNNGSENYGCLIGGWNGYGYMLYAGGPNYEGKMSLNIGGQGQNQIWTNDLIGTTDLRDNEWHSLTATYDGNTGKVFIDGVLEDSESSDDGLNFLHSNAPLLIGWPNHTGQSEAFTGLIDRVEIWDRALSSGEILENMHAHIEGDELGLVGLWSFNEGSGQTAIDLSGNGNDGTVVGASWVDSTPYPLTTIIDTVLTEQNTTTTTTNTITYDNLINYDEYTYSVSARDTAGNFSALSDQVTAIPYSTTNDHSLVFNVDADGHVDCGSDAVFDFGGGDFTLEVWLRPENTSQNVAIISRWTTSNDVSYQLNIASNGRLIKYENIKEKKKIKKLPYIFGKIDYKNFILFKELIDKSKFDYKDINLLYYFPNKRWDIKTKNNVLIKLSDTNILESLNIAKSIINNKNFKNENVIDLRILNYIITSYE